MDKEKLRTNIDFLLARENNLSSYAEYTALELDSYIAGSSIGFNAGQKLIKHIRDSVGVQATRGEKYLDSCLLVALSDAISDSKIEAPKRDVQSFLKQTDDIFSCLENVILSDGRTNDAKYDLISLRNFCLALSECASKQDYPYIKLWKEKEIEPQLCLI